MRPNSLLAKNLTRLGNTTIRNRASSTNVLPKVSTNPPPKSKIAARIGRVEVPKVAKNSLQQLHEIFHPSNPYATKASLADVVLVAIDFENTQGVKSARTVETNCQAGIAILDTKGIKQRPVDTLLRTYMFATGMPAYVAKASSRFIFGNTVSPSPSKLVNCIRSLIPPNRNVVFVGHGVTNDLQALQALGFQFSENIVGILDTLQIANEVFYCRAKSLSGLLKELDCPHSRLHCAGNDANFTLKALLLLAAKEFEKHNEDKRMIEILRRIGRRELPFYLQTEVKVRAKHGGERGTNNMVLSNRIRSQIAQGSKVAWRVLLNAGRRPGLIITTIIVGFSFVGYHMYKDCSDF